MMLGKQVYLSAAVIAFSAMSLLPAAAQAQQAEVGSMYYLTPIALVNIGPASDGAYTGRAKEEPNRRHWARYFEYEHRENCQKYVVPPPGWKYLRCKMVRIDEPQATLVTTIVPAASAAVVSMPAQAHLHTIYFDYDRTEIRPGPDRRELDAAINDIKLSNPGQVTVSGHADAAGTNSYNDDLSTHRTQVIANALVEGGISGNLIRQQAFGEERLAVQTPDGQPEQQNRRVTVDFVPSTTGGAMPGMQPGM